MAKIKVLELNNIDLIGRRFDGYNLLEYIRYHSETIDINMLVNQRTSDSLAIGLYSQIPSDAEFRLNCIEKDFLAAKNQLSLSEEALVRHKLYKEADILHFHMYHNMFLPIEFLERISCSKKIIIEIHDSFWLTDDCKCSECTKERKKGFPTIPVLKCFDYIEKNNHSLFLQRDRVLKDIDARFIVHSPYMLDLFKKSRVTHDLERVDLINFGVDTDLFRPMEKNNVNRLREKHKIRDEDIVLFFRAQDVFKGLEYIVDALRMMDTKRSKNVVILTVGNGRLPKDLTDRYRVINMDLINDDSAMVELYNMCDIFLAPSTEESFGFMATEAMACQKPVIVFPGTALPITTGAPSVGVLVEKRDSKLLLDKIILLMDDDPERMRRGLAGRDFVIKEYNLKKYFESYIKLFEEEYARPRKKIILRKQKKKGDCHNQLAKLSPAVQSLFFLQKTEDTKAPTIDYNDKDVQNALKKTNENIFRKLKRHYYLRKILSALKIFI